jgi:hypothetical protein
MMLIRKFIVPALTAVLTLGVAAPAASPSTPVAPTVPSAFPLQGTPWFTSAPLASAGGVSSISGPCGTSSGQEGQGATAGTASSVCSGAGLTFIGPAIGQVATVIGPTIIGPAVVGNLVVSAGNGNAG